MNGLVTDREVPVSVQMHMFLSHNQSAHLKVVQFRINFNITQKRYLSQITPFVLLLLDSGFYLGVNSFSLVVAEIPASN